MATATLGGNVAAVTNVEVCSAPASDRTSTGNPARLASVLAGKGRDVGTCVSPRVFHALTMFDVSVIGFTAFNGQVSKCFIESLSRCTRQNAHADHLTYVTVKLHCACVPPAAWFAPS